MAEQQDNGQERTEEPTPKRLREAREKGQVARSRELTMTLVMLTGSAALLLFGSSFVDGIRSMFADALVIERERIFDPSFMAANVRELAGRALVSILPLLGVLLLAALIAPALLGGWNFSLKAMAFKSDRLNPVKGLKRVFGSKGVMELLKAMGKFLVVGSGAMIFLWFSLETVLGLSRMGLRGGIDQSVMLVVLALFVGSATLILIAAIDVPFQLFTHQKQMRMTRQEVRDELKQTEGRPEVKSKLRNLQQQRAGKRMMQEVPKADVVINNPTHFAVALRYDPVLMESPMVVAKGADRMALAIRRVAKEHEVPQLQAAVLARALYSSVEPGQCIPPKLYMAVAEVLAWVHRLRLLKPGQETPAPPQPDLDQHHDY